MFSPSNREDLKEVSSVQPCGVRFGKPSQLKSNDRSLNRHTRRAGAIERMEYERWAKRFGSKSWFINQVELGQVGEGGILRRVRGRDDEEERRRKREKEHENMLKVAERMRGGMRGRTNTNVTLDLGRGDELLSTLGSKPENVTRGKMLLNTLEGEIETKWQRKEQRKGREWRWRPRGETREVQIRPGQVKSAQVISLSDLGGEEGKQGRTQGHGFPRIHVASVQVEEHVIEEEAVHGEGHIWQVLHFNTNRVNSILREKGGQALVSGLEDIADRNEGEGGQEKASEVPMGIIYVIITSQGGTMTLELRPNLT